MEIRGSNFKEALKLMHRVTTPPQRKVNYHDDAEQVQTRVHKSLKVLLLLTNIISLSKMFYLIFRSGACMPTWKKALAHLKPAKLCMIVSLN